LITDAVLMLMCLFSDDRQSHSVCWSSWLQHHLATWNMCIEDCHKRLPTGANHMSVMM